MVQGGDLKLYHIQSVVEVFSEEPFCYFDLKGAIRRGNNADIYLDGLVCADPPNFAVLQYPEKPDLRLFGQFSELIKELEEKFGVSAAAPVAVAAVGPAGDAGGAAAEEKTEFDVILAGAGDQKIKVIKEVRGITSLGLKEAKALVEGVPAPIKEGVTKEEAEEIKEKIAAVGGAVEIK